MRVFIRNTLSSKYTYYALIYSPNKYLLSIDLVSGLILGIWNINVGKDRIMNVIF